MPHLSVNQIWVLLLVATGVTFWLGESGTAGGAGSAPVVAIFVLAFVKAQYVILDFMELRHAPPIWRRLLIGWLCLVTSLILVAYWLSRR